MNWLNIYLDGVMVLVGIYCLAMAWRDIVRDVKKLNKRG